MKTALDFLKENIDQSNIPKEHYENEISEMMTEYALYYFMEELKKWYSMDSLYEILDYVVGCNPEITDDAHTKTVKEAEKLILAWHKKEIDSLKQFYNWNQVIICPECGCNKINSIGDTHSCNNVQCRYDWLKK